jgi:rubrerythrin
MVTAIRHQAVRDELAARAERRARTSRLGRGADAQRQLPRLAMRYADVQAQLAHAIETGGDTEALAAKLQRIDELRANCEVLSPGDEHDVMTAAPSPWSWLPPRLWTCPRCAATWLLREEKCPRCGRRTACERHGERLAARPPSEEMLKIDSRVAKQ